MNYYIDEDGCIYYCLNIIQKEFIYSYKDYYSIFITHTFFNSDGTVNPYHRSDGPAIILDNGDKEWYYHGQRIRCKDNKEFLKIISMRAFL